MLFGVLVLHVLPAYAENVLVLEDSVKDLMPSGQFPPVEAVINLIPEDDPLARYKRADLIMTLLSIIYRFPHMEPGEWNNLEKRYKRGFKQHKLRWPPPYAIEDQLEDQKFSAYALLMPAFFPEAYEIKPYPNNNHMDDIMVNIAALAAAAFGVLFVFALILRLVRR